MKIAIPKEFVASEQRVALVPEAISKLTKAGITVEVQAGAGAGAFISDDQFRAAGAGINPDPVALLSGADLILKVQQPALNPTAGKHEVEMMHEGAVLITFLEPLLNPAIVKMLAARKITSFSMDAVPRTTRAQKMDALSSMSSIAGYKSVLLGACALPRFFPMLVTAAGTIAPAQVLVLGAGVAGLQAIATARRLGAVVSAYDVRPAASEEVESLGGKFVKLDTGATDTQDAGGYAKKLSEDAHKKELELLKPHIKAADLVITTARVPGIRAPILITADAVREMRPGSVIIDLAADTGGNCELTRAGETVVDHEVSILGLVNVASTMPVHASQLYSRNLIQFVQHLIKDGALNLDFEDDITRDSCITHDGRIMNARTRALVDGPAAAPAGA